MTWKDYVGDRLITQHPSGFYIIKPKDVICSARPLFCPVCEIIMRTSYDDEAYDKFECCDECSSRWVYPDIDRWKSGWRPTLDEI